MRHDDPSSLQPLVDETEDHSISNAMALHGAAALAADPDGLDSGLLDCRFADGTVADRRAGQSHLTAVDPLAAPDPSGLKIMGERNSGTNFTAAVLQRNVELDLFPNAPGIPDDLAHLVRRSLFGFKRRRALQEALRDHQHQLAVPTCGGWKHAAATQRLLKDFAAAQGAFVLFVVRHPVTWSQSMHRNPFHGLAPVPRSYSGFLRSPWVCSGRDELGARLLQSPLDLYARKYESYRWFTSVYRQSAILRYEDLLADPGGALARIGVARFRKTGPVSLPAQSARGAGRGNLDLSRYRTKAEQTGYAAVSPEDQSFLRDRLAGSGLLDIYPL